jgi:hypothetical protein
MRNHEQEDEGQGLQAADRQAGALRTHDRCTAICYLDGTDISEEIVRLGWCATAHGTAAGGTSRPSERRPSRARRSTPLGAKAMMKVGLQVMSAVLLPLVCGSCATQSGILYGSKIELDAGSDRGNGSKAKVDGVGLFFSGKFGRIELGKEDGTEDAGSGAG